MITRVPLNKLNVLGRTPPAVNAGMVTQLLATGFAGLIGDPNAVNLIAQVRAMASGWELVQGRDLVDTLLSLGWTSMPANIVGDVPVYAEPVLPGYTRLSTVVVSETIQRPSIFVPDYRNGVVEPIYAHYTLNASSGAVTLEVKPNDPRLAAAGTAKATYIPIWIVQTSVTTDVALG